MPEIKRDPRIDPKPGDVLRKNGDTREVRLVGCEFIEIHTTTVRDGTHWFYPSPARFRRWAKDAEVIHAGK